jgi:FkbM family methyltransferase
MEIKRAVWLIREIFLGVRKYKNWIDISISIFKGQNPTSVILRNGIQVDAPEDNTLLQMVDEIFFRNLYSPINFNIKNNDIVVDIGANIGVFSLFAASRTHNTVYAFEPFPKNVEFLNRNIHKNGLHNIIVHCAAVSDKIGSAKLFLSEISAGHLLFDHNIMGKLEKYTEVPTITLQSIMDDNKLDKIDFLKLDCEGSEGSILMSTPKDYLKRIGNIAMEFHDNVSLLKHDDIKRLLDEVGFVTKLNWSGKSPFGYLYGKRS